MLSFLIGKGTEVGHDQMNTVKYAPSLGHLYALWLSQPSHFQFTTSGAHSMFLQCCHFPALLLTTSDFVSPKTVNIFSSLPPSQLFGLADNQKGTSLCAHHPIHSVICICAQICSLPYLRCWRGIVHVPMEGCHLHLLKIITLVPSAGAPQGSPVSLPCGPSSHLRALPFAVHPGERLISPDIPMTSSLPSFNSSLIFTLLVNSPWSSCSNLQSPAPDFLFLYSTLFFSISFV